MNFFKALRLNAKPPFIIKGKGSFPNLVTIFWKATPRVRDSLTSSKDWLGHRLEQ